MTAVTKSSTDPFDFLARLRAAAQGGYPIPADVAQWLEGGICEFGAQGGRKPLCLCLKLRGAGVVSLETARARQRRDAALLAACEIVPGPSMGDWGRCRVVADVAIRFARIWPRVPAPPDTDRALFHSVEVAFGVAADAGLRVPVTPSGILARVRIARRYQSLGDGDR